MDRAGALGPEDLTVSPSSFLSRFRVSVQWEPPTVSGVSIWGGSRFRYEQRAKKSNRGAASGGGSVWTRFSRAVGGVGQPSG